ncbi:hypothetical protein OIDMADRAFT_137892 [Oidiodendron maius Zn]|uniref:Zn(2)-C6 fungal-type domain-containing protein n=1 Tax=Oidiodendron maius (strain Zn) TaxID=913774 RepID=A0A0C3C3E9_OIDMZ|nr:hypothetical protein OIDMADRAFT_137892 [Oidiodendron maius Zn]
MLHLPSALADHPLPARPTRSRLGCRTCRDKKVKCDEQHPKCRRCKRLHLDCDYTVRPRKKYIRTPNRSPAIAPGQAELAGSDLEPALGTSLSPACARILSPADYAAIRCFRLEVVAAPDTKVPEYSGPALVWVLAEKDPMVLHMVCALGARKLSLRGSMPAEEVRLHQSRAVEHYGAALRLLAAQNLAERSELDFVLATLWLMIAYEHKYEDGCGMGLRAHLQGAASLLRERARNIWSPVTRDVASISSHEGSSPQLDSDTQHGTMSPLESRMIIWIALIDGGAALNGLGGAFNDLLEVTMFSTSEYPAVSRVRAFAALQRHSDLVCQDVWGSSYPQSELVEDLEISQILCLYAECGQLRYLLSKLDVADQRPASRSASQSGMLAAAMRDVGERYGELLSVASRLELPAPGLPQRRFVKNLRHVASYYHAVRLSFFRIIHHAAPLSGKQREILREIMTMAFKAHHDEGEQAMIRVAWPLFVAALESDESLHRIWILERYEALSGTGENFRRARHALRVAFQEQQLDERRVNYAELVRRSDIDPFVL